MAHCKSLIVDRFVENEKLPPNIRIVACCNPYRLRKNLEQEQMGLVYQHHFAEGGLVSRTDHMKKLVYRVHELPESLMDLVSDFGALSNETERIYIDAILKRELPIGPGSQQDPNALRDYKVFIGSFVRLVYESQHFIREISMNERSVVSLRDVARASRVFRWFLKHYTKWSLLAQSGSAGVPGMGRSDSAASASAAAGDRLSRADSQGLQPSTSVTTERQ